MNSIAARALSNLFLPSSHRTAQGATASGTGTGGSTPPSSSAPRQQRRSSPGGSLSSPPQPPASQQQQQQQQRGMHPPSTSSSSQVVSSGPVRILPDIVSHMCSHPHYRLLTLRSIPQVCTLEYLVDLHHFVLPESIFKGFQILFSLPMNSGSGYKCRLHNFHVASHVETFATNVADWWA